MLSAVATTPRCIVVGGGLLGLSTAWALTRRPGGEGSGVHVIEAAAAVGHERSGSKGGARIFRLGYPDPRDVDLAQRAGSLWRSLEGESGRRLLHGTGQVTFGDVVEDVAVALSDAGASFERLATGEVRTRFGGNLAVEGPALYEPASGVLAADECLLALSETAAASPLEVGTSATSVRDSGDGVAVELVNGSTLQADVAVVCAGPASLGLLGGDAAAAAVAAAPSLPQVAYFKAADPGGAGRAGTPLPVFIEWGPDMIYGLPVPGVGPHSGLYKVSHHTPGRGELGSYHPADPAPFVDDPELIELLTGAVTRLLPHLDPMPVATERCVYDNTADENPVLDRIGNVVVGCGTSGHGFKFGPLFGELLASLVLGTEPAVDLGRFALGRAVPAKGPSR
jgi:sarcosine oxidase